MGGFLSGLGTLLGGFNAQRRIDKEGFDWKEQADQQEAMRKRQTQEWQQSDEDRAQSQLTDYMSAQDLDAEPDVAGAEPLMSGVDVAKRKAFITTALGRRKQQKDYLESLKGQNRLDTQDRKLEGQKELLGLTWDEKEAFEKMKNGMPVSATDQAKLAAAEKRTGMTIDAMLTNARMREAGADRRFQGGGEKPLYRTPVTQNENGEAGTYQVFADGRREWYPSAPTVTQRDTAGMAGGVMENIQGLRDVAGASGEDVVAGPITGRLSKMWQSLYPSGKEGEFDSRAKQLVDIVYIKSGKQINQNEMKILADLIPTRAKGNIDFQIDQFERYAEQLLSKYNRKRPGSAPAGGGGHPSGGPPQPRSRAEYEALPSGTQYMAPDGKVRRKP